MSSWESFDLTFQFNRDLTYDKKLIDRINGNRRSLENQLFIDRLLGLMGVQAGMTMTVIARAINLLTSFFGTVQEAYPPKSNQDLRELYKQILRSSFPSHQKQAVIYSLLQDCRGSTEAINQFVRRCSLPEKYQLFIDGLWQLDRLEFRVFCLPTHYFNAN
jgi:Nuclear pore complex assembly